MPTAQQAELLCLLTLPSPPTDSGACAALGGASQLLALMCGMPPSGVGGLAPLCASLGARRLRLVGDDGTGVTQLVAAERPVAVPMAAELVECMRAVDGVARAALAQLKEEHDLGAVELETSSLKAALEAERASGGAAQRPQKFWLLMGVVAARRLLDFAEGADAAHFASFLSHVSSSSKMRITFSKSAALAAVLSRRDAFEAAMRATGAVAALDGALEKAVRDGFGAARAARRPPRPSCQGGGARALARRGGGGGPRGSGATALEVVATDAEPLSSVLGGVDVAGGGATLLVAPLAALERRGGVPWSSFVLVVEFDALPPELAVAAALRQLLRRTSPPRRGRAPPRPGGGGDDAGEAAPSALAARRRRRAAPTSMCLRSSRGGGGGGGGGGGSASPVPLPSRAEASAEPAAGRVAFVGEALLDDVRLHQLLRRRGLRLVEPPAALPHLTLGRQGAAPRRCARRGGGGGGVRGCEEGFSSSTSSSSMTTLPTARRSSPPRAAR